MLLLLYKEVRLILAHFIFFKKNPVRNNLTKVSSPTAHTDAPS